MKQHLLIFSIAATLVTGAPQGFAAAFEPKDVAAAPAILFHLDFDALRASSIGQTVLSDPQVQDKLSAVAALFDFDLRTQLHGVTVYTTEDHPKDGALIVYADFDPKRLVTLAKAADDSQVLTNGSHVIYTWLDDKKKAKNGERPRVYGAISGHRVVFGQNESHLAAALDVIDGAAPAFAGKDGLPAADAGESVIAEGVLLKFDFDGADQNAAIFKMSKSVRLKVGESGNNIAAKVKFEASDADTAMQISSIAQGLLAFLKLQKGDANATKLANAIAIKQDGAVVAVTLTTPSSDLIAILKDGQKKAEAKEAEEEARRETKENK